jgi:mRNA interferase MazF
MVMVVPLTSQLAALRFPHTVRVEPSPQNGLTTPSVLMVFQLRAVDRIRISRIVGSLEEHYIMQLDEEIKRMLAL